MVTVDGEPWFVARDVTFVLGYVDAPKAIAAHCKAGRKVGDSPTLHPQTVLIPERDVYRLVMRSKLPTAERFEEWGVGEVQPTIRETGSFVANAANPTLGLLDV
ncbi:hypothetical protein WI91_08065 [Burkholderia vietnamiensis]|uniref:BRO-N domain-containing protein n=1 Tax=Burkholderia vietnamiensis TaxID=60552 RepID=UPI000758EE2D|nr:BRO family protein [Burkholderia vietnamiensis]KVE06293.1 hypothetical protein WI91_08065 [Burkholderia vietnamiensis]